LGSSKFSEREKLLADMVERDSGVHIRCVVCQFRVIEALNGGGSNADLLKKRDFAQLEDATPIAPTWKKTITVICSNKR